MATVRTTRVEIIVPKERRDIWRGLAVECQRIKNYLWRRWIADHTQNRSDSKIREALDGKSKAWPVDIRLGNKSYAGMLESDAIKEFPGVNSRTTGLLVNTWMGTLSKRKSANGSLPGWVSILLGNEAIPSFNRTQPIPFDSKNSLVAKEGDDYILNVRIDRLPSDLKRSPSTKDSCIMLLRKRKCGSVRAIVDRIISGEYTFKGSSLDYKNGKWFALIAYQKPVEDKHFLDPSKTMYIRPGINHPWRVRIGKGRSFAMGGNGMHVNHAREAITRERKSRQEHYRYAGSAQKGHGRSRACAVWTKLSSRWKDFTKRYNNEVSRRIVDLAVSSGCGTIVYLKPLEGKQRFFLSRTDGDTRTSWDYFQMGTMLASKSEEKGVVCEVKETQGGKSRAKAEAPARRVQGVRKASEPKPAKRAQRK